MEKKKKCFGTTLVLLYGTKVSTKVTTIIFLLLGLMIRNCAPLSIIMKVTTSISFFNFWSVFCLVYSVVSRASLTHLNLIPTVFLIVFSSNLLFIYLWISCWLWNKSRFISFRSIFWQTNMTCKVIVQNAWHEEKFYV